MRKGAELRSNKKSLKDSLIEWHKEQYPNYPNGDATRFADEILVIVKKHNRRESRAQAKIIQSIEVLKPITYALLEEE
jgi:hypothetical protein